MADYAAYTHPMSSAIMMTKFASFEGAEQTLEVASSNKNISVNVNYISGEKQ